MLSRSHRVSTSLFNAAIATSAAYHSPFFTMRVAKGALGETRIAVVVSKKIDTRATKRNSIRRKGYAALQKLLQEIKPGATILFFVKKGIEKLSVEEMRIEMQNLFNRAGLLTI